LIGNRNTPIGIANRVLTKDVPWVAGSVDRFLTGGRIGKILGYIFSPATPVIMVSRHLQTRSELTLDYISVFDDGGNMGVFQDDVEKYSWTGCVVDTLVHIQKTRLIMEGGLCLW